MNIVWLCNIEIPLISDILGKQKCIFGGWLDITSRKLITDNNKLTIIYPSQEKQAYSDSSFSFYSFSSNKELELVVEKHMTLNEVDVIHIWGTEFQYSNFFVHLLRKKNKISKVVISIQGLSTLCSEHYFEGLPKHIIYRYTLRDFIKHKNINNCKKIFSRNGKFEVDTLKNV